MSFLENVGSKDVPMIIALWVLWLGWIGSKLKCSCSCTTVSWSSSDNHWTILSLVPIERRSWIIERELQLQGTWEKLQVACIVQPWYSSQTSWFVTHHTEFVCRKYGNIKGKLKIKFHRLCYILENLVSWDVQNLAFKRTCICFLFFFFYRT